MKWLQTDYFDSFRCKCGDCRFSCCDAWSIAISEEEYHRLSNLTCSDDMFRKLQCAFQKVDDPAPGRYMVFARNFLGQCPMHASSGLCSLQVELGEKILPEICRVFPRSMHRKGTVHRAVCSAGCEGVVEILDREEPLDFVEVENDLPVDLVNDASPDFYEIFRSYTDVIHDRSLPIAKRVERICQMLDPSFSASMDISKGIESLLSAIDQLKNYSPTLDEMSSSLQAELYTAERYPGAAALFEQNHPSWEKLFENLILNHLFYEDFPDTDPRISSKDSIYGLCFLYALMRVMCIARSSLSDIDLIDTLACVFRYAEHSSFYYNARVTIPDPSVLLCL